jgi:hypothetical protein
MPSAGEYKAPPPGPLVRLAVRCGTVAHGGMLEYTQNSHQSASEEYMPDLAPVFAELGNIMAPYAVKLNATRDDERELYVDTHHVQKNKKPLFFGAVQIKKSYVS